MKKPRLKTVYEIRLVVEDDNQPEPLPRRELLALFRRDLPAGVRVRSAKIDYSEARLSRPGYGWDAKVTEECDEAVLQRKKPTNEIAPFTK